MTFAADSKDEAEMLAKEYVLETYPNAFDIELVEVDELPGSERGVRGFGSSAA